MREMREYLSNFYEGPRPRLLTDFNAEDLAGRQAFVRSEERFAEPRVRPLAIFQLHWCDTGAVTNPRSTMPHALFGLELARKTKDADIVSWAQSGIGNLSRLLTEHDEALEFLRRARKGADSLIQKADATRLLGVLFLTLAKDDPKEIKRALSMLSKAFRLSAPTRVNSDRGHTMVLNDKAIAHLHLGVLQNDRGHVRTGKEHLLEVLETASPLHAKRSRRAALMNLVDLSHKFGERPDPSFIAELQNSKIPQSSLHGAMMKWTLIYEEIYVNGYSRKFRKRLLRVRNHLVQNEAFEYAAQLTLSIAALDASHEKPGALTFLQSDDTEKIISKGAPELLGPIMDVHYMAPNAIVSLAREAGAGNVEDMVQSIRL
jgi:hypothetical protein